MPQEKRKLRKRLSMDVPTEIHKAIKTSTIDRNCTITKWVLRAITNQLKDEIARGEGTPRHKGAS